MRHIKSERLKKLEIEYSDLEHWLKLGLVPKKDVEKHKEEMRVLEAKIEEEKERLQFLKESGEAEEYITPKRAPTRAGYAEMPTIPDIDVGETGGGFTNTGFDMETEAAENETTLHGSDQTETGDDRTSTDEDKGDDVEEEEEEESPFSDRNRWRRGGIIDPDADDW